MCFGGKNEKQRRRMGRKRDRMWGATVDELLAVDALTMCFKESTSSWMGWGLAMREPENQGLSQTAR